MINKKKIIASTLFTLLPILAGVLLWNKLPDTVPIHWNLSGEIDGWAPKTVAIIPLPLLLAALNFACIFATHADNKKREQNKKMMSLVYWICPALSIVLSGIIYCTSLGFSFNAVKITPFATGILFFIIGNYMPKCRYNRTIGIRIPTTLKSEENWDKTHFFAGKIWVVGSVFIILSAFLPENIMFWVFLPVVIIMALVPIIYSVAISKKK